MIVIRNYIYITDKMQYFRNQFMSFFTIKTIKKFVALK